ncbi:glutathione S-transferase [Magnetospira thiophila]
MMQLAYSPTSPFVRKVIVTAHECGLFARLEMLPKAAFQEGHGPADVNPLGKVPALRLAGGEVLYDSPVICEYLDSLHDGVALFPPSGGTRWTALRRQALGDGIMDAAVAIRMESLRPEGEQSPTFAFAQRDKITAALDVLEGEADELGQGSTTIGQIAIACALGYLDFRFAATPWRTERPRLKAWNDLFAARKSMTETIHSAP